MECAIKAKDRYGCFIAGPKAFVGSLTLLSCRHTSKGKHMSDSYDDYEAKIQRAEQASPLWEMVKTEHDKQIEIAQAYERGWNAALAQLAAWMTRQGYATGHGDTIEDLLKELEWQIENRIKNIIRAKPAKPLRLFALQIGDTFVLRRNKQRFKLVNLPWIKGMSKQYICQNLENGQFTRLHHSVLVEQVEKHKE